MLLECSFMLMVIIVSKTDSAKCMLAGHVAAGVHIKLADITILVASSQMSPLQFITSGNQ